ncbi:MAG: hypothetical protein ACREJQ_06890, partial [bacterium]
TVTIMPGPNTPPPTIFRSRGAVNVPIMQIVVAAGSTEDAEVADMTLTATGTGDDSTGIKAVIVYLDSNGDGQVTPGEPVVAGGVYSSDNGSLALSFSPPIIVPAASSVTLLVAYDFAP